MPKVVNNVQELLLELIECASFNAFNGPKVVADLRANKDLWSGVLMTRDYYPLIILRDIEEHNYYNVDTMYITSSGMDDDKLMKMVRAWRANDLDWLGDVGGPVTVNRILRLWWD